MSENESKITIRWWERIRLFWREMQSHVDYEENLIIYYKKMDGVIYFIREEKL